MGFAILVYQNGRSSKINQSWFYFSAVLSTWALSLYGVVSSSSSQTAWYWQLLLDFSASFVPVLYLNFTLNYLGWKHKILTYIVGVASLVMGLFSFSPLFKTGMTVRFGFNWINAGPYYFVFPLFFILVILLSLILLYREYKRDKNDLIRSQVLYLLIGSTLGFIGGVTNFLPQLFNVYPFGNYFITVYVAFMGYSMIKHRLFNAKAIATELFAGAIMILFLFNVFTYSSTTDLIIRVSEFIVSTIFAYLLVKAVDNEISQREHIQKLATDLASTNKELESANDKLKELDKQKTEFVSLASHQLRSPLTAIKGYSSMILEGDYGKITGKMKEAVGRVFESSQKLVLVIEDFLNITRIELGRIKYDMTEWSFNTLIKNVIGEQKPNIERRGLAISYEEDAPEYTVYADQGKVSQVISNLIDNSVKYTKQGSLKVKVAGVTNSEGKKAVRFTVTDTGVGIDPKTMPHLFQKFSRADDASKTNIIGTGLGLYVAKQIMDAHQGKIWAESAGKDQGSTFLVELALTTGIAPIPVIPPAEIESNPTSPEPALGTPKPLAEAAISNTTPPESAQPAPVLPVPDPLQPPVTPVPTPTTAPAELPIPQPDDSFVR